MFFDNLHIFLSVPKLFAEFSVVSVLRVLRKTRVWQAYIVYFMVPYIYIYTYNFYGSNIIWRIYIR